MTIKNAYNEPGIPKIGMYREIDSPNIIISTGKRLEESLREANKWAHYTKSYGTIQSDWENFTEQWVKPLIQIKPDYAPFSQPFITCTCPSKFISLNEDYEVLGIRDLFDLWLNLKNPECIFPNITSNEILDPTADPGNPSWYRCEDCQGTFCGLTYYAIGQETAEQNGALYKFYQTNQLSPFTKTVGPIKIGNLEKALTEYDPDLDALQIIQQYFTEETLPRTRFQKLTPDAHKEWIQAGADHQTTIIGLILNSITDAKQKPTPNTVELIKETETPQNIINTAIHQKRHGQLTEMTDIIIAANHNIDFDILRELINS